MSNKLKHSFPAADTKWMCVSYIDGKNILEKPVEGSFKIYLFNIYTHCI